MPLHFSCPDRQFSRFEIPPYGISCSFHATSPQRQRPLKPWPNGVASRRKLKTWVYLRLRLARPCVHLRWLAMTYAHFGRDQICTQVKASFSPFGHPTQVIASWVASINLLLANEIQDMSTLRCLFLRLTSTCEETCESVWPPNASLYASSTCIHLRLLAGPFGQGLKCVPTARVTSRQRPVHQEQFKRSPPFHCKMSC